MKNNISDLAPKRKTDKQKIKRFEKWMTYRIKNMYIGNNESMCNAYQIVLE